MDLLLLAELYNVLGQYESAHGTIKKGTRCLQGRLDQNYWDLARIIGNMTVTIGQLVPTSAKEVL